MADNIIKIEELHKELQSLQPLSAENQQKLDRKFRLEFNYNSNHLEGNTLTYGETVLLLIFGKTEGQHEIREYEEMQAHDVAYELVKDWAADHERPLTETAIKNLNEIILVRPFWKEAITPDGQATRRLIKVGGYKEIPNSVRLQNGEMFHYASVTDTPIQMGELVEWFRQEEEKNKLHPVALAALLHYKFVIIHPFDDGNGRISRLLMNYVLLKNGYPPVIIKSAAKKDYLFALNQADSGNLNAFVDYISKQLLWSLDICIKAARGESVEEADDIDKEIAVLKKKISSNNLEYNRRIKTDEKIVALIKYDVFPLFVELTTAFKKFDELFENTKTIVEFKIFNSSRLGGRPNHFELPDSADEFIKLLPVEQNLEELKIDFSFTYFKAQGNSFSLSLTFGYRLLGHFKYTRFFASEELNKRESKEDDYDVFLSVEEMKNVSKAWQTRILDYIKSQST